MIFGGNFFADILAQSTHWIFWDKLNTMPTFGDGELIWTNSPRKSVKKFVREYNGLIGKEEERKHPTQKPNAVCDKLILSAKQNEGIVLSPFAGVGSECLSAKKNGLKFIGFEINPDYIRIAEERLLREL